MSDTLSCSDCGAEIESMDELETGHEVTEIEPEADGTFTLFENRDLFLCKNCGNPMGLYRR